MKSKRTCFSFVCMRLTVFSNIICLSNYNINVGTRQKLRYIDDDIFRESVYPALSVFVLL